MVGQSIMFGLTVTEWIIRCDEIALFQSFEDFTRPTTILNGREFKDFLARVAASSSRQQTNNFFYAISILFLCKGTKNIISRELKHFISLNLLFLSEFREIKLVKEPI
jgi:hypothetical protein